jgi:hypothetical protein
MDTKIGKSSKKLKKIFGLWSQYCETSLMSTKLCP